TPCLTFVLIDLGTTKIYSLYLHDALPICVVEGTDLEERGGAGTGRLDIDVHDQRELIHQRAAAVRRDAVRHDVPDLPGEIAGHRSEEHTSEFQSRENLVCRLLLEKKKRSK